jgi:hypothetical protein
MLRTLGPYLALAVAIVVVTAVAYAYGAPVWAVYVGTLLAVFAVLPGWERWDQRHHP